MSDFREVTAWVRQEQASFGSLRDSRTSTPRDAPRVLACNERRSQGDSYVCDRFAHYRQQIAHVRGRLIIAFKRVLFASVVVVLCGFGGECGDDVFLDWGRQQSLVESEQLESGGRASERGRRRVSRRRRESLQYERFARRTSLFAIGL
jgi:hypothetical protein